MDSLQVTPAAPCRRTGGRAPDTSIATSYKPQDHRKRDLFRVRVAEGFVVVGLRTQHSLQAKLRDQRKKSLFLVAAEFLEVGSRDTL